MLSIKLGKEEVKLPYWLYEGNIELEKRKIVLFIKKWETLSEGIVSLWNALWRMPKDIEIFNYFR